MRPLDPRLVAHASAARTHIAITAFIGTLSAGLVLYQASLLGPGLAAFFDGDFHITWLTPLCAVIVLRSLLAWLSDTSSARSSAVVKAQLRHALARKVATQPGAAAHSASDIATLATRGLDALDPYFARYLPALIMAVTVPLGAGMWILSNDRISAVIVAVTVPLVPFFMILVGRFTASETQRQWTTMQVLGGRFLDLVTGITTLKAFNRSQAQGAAVATAGEAYRVTTMRVLRVSFLSALVLELISTVSVALVAVSIGLRLDNGTMHLREALTVLILVP